MTKILFMGRKQVSADLLEFFHSQLDLEIVGVLTDSHLQGSPTAEMARQLELPLYVFDEALQRIESGELVYDLGISVLYWRKLKGAFLSHPSKGVINFHPAILPQYKGTGGYNLAILDGLSEWGVSAHYVDEEIDTGEIIEVSYFPIESEQETAVSMERKSMLMLEKLTRKIVVQAAQAKGLLPSTPNEGGRYVSRAEMEGMKKIEAGDNVGRKVRAFWFPPYDGAYVEIDGHRFTLVSRDILQTLSPPGTTSLFAPGAEC